MQIRTSSLLVALCFIAPGVVAQTTPSGGATPPADQPTAQPTHQPAPQPAAPPAEKPPADLAHPDDLRFELTLWLWAVGLSGDVGLRALDVSVSPSFLDLMDASDSIFAFSGRFEFGIGDFGGYVDGMYSDLTADDQSGPVGIASVDVEFVQTILDFGAMYRLGDWEPKGDASKNPRNMTLDLYAGGRYNSVELELRPANLPARSGREDWVDPIVGLKFVTPFAEHWHTAVNSDIGGFGVASDFTWSMTGVIGYDFHIFETPASVKFGYRAIGWDYSKGSGTDQFTWDVIEHGLLLGFEVRF